MFFSVPGMSFQVSEGPLRTSSSSACTNLRRRQGNFLKNFKGVSLNDLSYFEQRHNLRIHVYSLHFHPQDNSRLPFARLERRPLHVGDSSTTDLYLNLFDYTHFSYIHNLSLYAQTFGCTRCPKLLKSSKDLLYHLRTCTGSTKHTYKGGVYLPKNKLLQELEECGIYIPDSIKFSCYTCIYHFESLLVPVQQTDEKKPIFLLLLYHPR